jgi:type II secretory pathway pseudopilin PulG
MRPIGESRLDFEAQANESRGGRRNTKRYKVITTQRLEGSRFLTGQLCKSAASGSRGRFRVGQFYERRRCANRSTSEEKRWVQILLWDVSGSRPQLGDRTAKRQSGSPPGARYPSGLRSRIRRQQLAGLSLVELLVVLLIIAFISALITTSVLSALKQQNQRVCLNNMYTIEAAKDEYLRDHPGVSTIPGIDAFQPYFRFGMPKCPDGGTYNNVYSLTQPVTCTYHTANSVYPSATPTP